MYLVVYVCLDVFFVYPWFHWCVVSLCLSLVVYVVREFVI